jgi:hypothetical protein
LTPYLVTSPAFAQQDRAPFQFNHNLTAHPALEYGNLQRTIPTLAEQHVYYSVKRMGKGDDFERAVTSERHAATIESVLEELPHSNGYVMIRKPEVLAPFAELSRQLVEEVSETVRARGHGMEAKRPMLYLFISSPNSVTPFHFDRMSNFLFQVRGTKEITVFKPFDPAVISQEEYEAHMSRKEGVSVRWRPEVEHLGQRFPLGPGDGTHVPFCSGHFVHNGPELSISIAIFFSHPLNERRGNSLLFNQKLRPLLAHLGASPVPVDQNPNLDRTKAAVVRVANGLKRRFDAVAERINFTTPAVAAVPQNDVAREVAPPTRLPVTNLSEAAPVQDQSDRGQGPSSRPSLAQVYDLRPGTSHPSNDVNPAQAPGLRAGIKT